jgi:hypothetical protein
MSENTRGQHGSLAQLSVCFAKRDERLSISARCASVTPNKWVKLRSSMS